MGSRTCRVVILSYKFIVSFIIMCLFVVTVAYARPDSTRKVLILNSYHKEFKWTDDQVSGAKEVLSEGIKDIELFVEYMDTKRIYNKEYIEYLYNIYRLKYKKVQLDAIITTDDNALWFVVKYHKEVFGEAPVSFCGINDYKKSLLEGKQQFTGLVEVMDIKPTIDLALKLHPETRKIVVIVDSTPTGLGQIRDVTAVARQYNNLKFEYLEGKDISHAELFEKLQSLSRDSIVLLTVWLRDKNNVYLSSDEGGRLISSNSTVPVYGIIDMYYGFGIVGGKLLNSRTHGRIAAEKALLVINGEKPVNIPVISTSTNPYMFDYKQLERWRISVSDVPKGSIIINKPISFYEEQKRLIWIVIGVFALLISIVASLTMNIFRRKQAEEALRESEEKYKTILASIEDSYFEVNQRGEVTFFNEAFSEIIGYPPDELMGMKNDKYLDQENRIKVFKKFNEVWKTGIPTKLFEYEVIRKNGEKRTVQTSASLMTDENGQKIGFRGIIRDISDHKLMEKALQESEEKYRSMMGAMQDPAYICSPDFRVEYMNPAMIKRTGRDATGELCYKVIDECEEKCPWCVHDKVMQGDYKITEIISPKDGHYYSVSHSPIHHVDGSISKFTLYRDVTELKKLEQQLQQAMKMESIGTLAGGIAHDFNNILSPIMVHSELVMMDLPPDNPAQHNLREIFKAGERARDMVKQILAFSRKGEGKLVTIKITPILKEVLKLLRSSIPSTIDIHQKVEAESDTVFADPTQIHQILLNLCTNASHAMRESGGELSLHLTEEHLDQEAAGKFSDLNPGPYLKLIVSDTGHGIEAETMNRIFEPYFTTKEPGEGTGMGLAMVHGIVKSYDGDITVESEQGKGTTFNVYLPRIEADVSPVVEHSVQLPKGTERILFVDDEKGAVDAIQLMLENLGYNVTTRTSSIEALELFRNKPDAFDLVITDMTMPNMTGKDLAKELMSFRSDIPIILCTGFSEKINERRALEMGISAFVMKPIVTREIANTIRKVLGDKK